MGIMRLPSEEFVRSLPRESKKRFFCSACYQEFTCTKECEPCIKAIQELSEVSV